MMPETSWSPYYWVWIRSLIPGVGKDTSAFVGPVWPVWLQAIMSPGTDTPGRLGC
jgi:hypothetical protein